MPRKAAATAAPADDSVPADTTPTAVDSDANPARRSSRLASRDKPTAPKKAPAKPRGRKPKPTADGDNQDSEVEAKPKSARGKKRTVAEKAAEEGAQPESEEAPAPKKVVLPLILYRTSQDTDPVIRLNPNPSPRRSLHPKLLQSQLPRQPPQNQSLRLRNLRLEHPPNLSQPLPRNPLQEQAQRSLYLRWDTPHSI